jgi:hypothetical protein
MTLIERESTSAAFMELPVAAGSVSKNGIKQAQASFQGRLVHLGPKFADNMLITLETIPSLIATTALQEKVSKVYKTTEKFDFNTNGFGFLQFLIRKGYSKASYWSYIMARYT